MRKAVLTALAAAALFFPAGNAGCAQWALVAENVRNDAFYIDRESIVRTGNSVRYLRKVKFAPNAPFKETDALQEIDCQGKRMRSLSMTILRADGESETIMSDAWMDIEPDTVFAAFYELACPDK